jgi:glycosyltransferase involved in cell wall biosynthesis
LNIVDKHLHIVCPDIPYPVDYGGVFDVFYKLKALSEAGVLIHLHCYAYGREKQAELNKYCTEVIYYSRKLGIKGISSRLPYIVSSRNNEELSENLLKDDYPILLEGVHCSLVLFDERFKGRKIILRLFNVEFLYYRELSGTANSLHKKLYYKYESKLLYNYEKELARRVLILALSADDAAIYRQQFKAKNIMYMPAFLPYTEVRAKEGIADYCLYHGNLSVSENEKAVLWLLKDVFNELRTPLVIAGKAPSAFLEKECSKRSNTCVVANPTDQEMQDLIAKAQINVLPSFNTTGVKLKLLNALFNGRHCVVNEAAILGTSLVSACHVGSNATAMKSIITQLSHQPFTEEDIKLRKFLLEGIYNNETNVRQLIPLIW